MRFKKILSLFLLIITFTWLTTAYSMTAEEAKGKLDKMQIEFTNLEFIRAVKQGNLKIINLFLTAGISPDSRNRSEGDTVLMLMSERGKTGVVETLLKSGADVNAVNNYDESALMRAAAAGQYLIVKMLLDRGADVNAVNIDNETALIMAAQKGDYRSIEALLGSGAIEKADLKAEEGKSALMQAASRGYAEAVKMMLKKGVKPDVRNQKQQTALTLAVNNNHIEATSALVKGGADVNVKNRIHWTPLMESAANNRMDIVKILLRSGADVNAKDSFGETALMQAAYEAYVEIADILIKKGADVNADDSGYTALIIAVLNGSKKYNKEFINLLLENGADLDIKRKEDGKTALMLATEKGLKEIAEILKEAGAGK
jgi:ankyrin repeat protein